MNNERDPDGQFCSECGADMEVIGPPGPSHRAGCSRGEEEAERLRRLYPDSGWDVVGFEDGDFMRPIMRRRAK